MIEARIRATLGVLMFDNMALAVERDELKAKVAELEAKLAAPAPEAKRKAKAK